MREVPPVDTLMKPRASMWLAVLTQPVIVYVLAGYFAVYVSFFLLPVFLNSDRVMQFPHYIPTYDPIGNDWRISKANLESWSSTGKLLDPMEIPYPPLGYILVYPLLFTDAQLSYAIVTVSTVLAFGLATFVVPWLIGSGRNPALQIVTFCFVTGLTSYGLQFELERGQFNVVAISLCLLAVYIFHYQFKHRYFGYLLFLIAVQLKVYPCIFVVLFVANWSHWTRNLFRLAALVSSNIALLFVLGLDRLTELARVLARYSAGRGVWVGNHSIHSFAKGLAGSDLVQKAAWAELFRDAWSVQVLVLAIVLTSALIILLASMSRKQAGVDGALLLACTVLALVLPAVSHDYTLALLAGPMAIYLGQVGTYTDPKRQAVINILVLSLSLAYSSTLFSYVYKPAWLGNNLPMLVIILVVAAVMTRFSADLNTNALVVEAS